MTDKPIMPTEVRCPECGVNPDERCISSPPRGEVLDTPHLRRINEVGWSLAQYQAWKEADANAEAELNRVNSSDYFVRLGMTGMGVDQANSGSEDPCAYCGHRAGSHNRGYHGGCDVDPCERACDEYVPHPERRDWGTSDHPMTKAECDAQPRQGVVSGNALDPDSMIEWMDNGEPVPTTGRTVPTMQEEDDLLRARIKDELMGVGLWRVVGVLEDDPRPKEFSGAEYKRLAETMLRTFKKSERERFSNAMDRLTKGVFGE